MTYRKIMVPVDGSATSNLGLREGIRLAIARRTPPLPKTGIFNSGDPHLAENADEHLRGFGER